MITIMVLFCLLLVLAFIAAVLMGVIAVSPVLLVFMALILIDVLVCKTLFGRKKK